MLKLWVLSCTGAKFSRNEGPTLEGSSYLEHVITKISE
jgi:hypothetical protein